MASYKGIKINPGTDADIAAQVAAIDAGAAPAAVPPAPVVPGAAPVVPGATPATAYKGLDLGTYDSTADTLLSRGAATAAAAASTLPDEKKIYRDKLKMYQADIDATNKIYAEKLAQTVTQGTSNLGSARAVAARSGTLGSDFGNAQNDRVVASNTAAEDLVRQEQALKISAILGLARKDAADEVAAKRTAQQKGLTDYLTYLGEQTTRRTSNTSKVAKAILDQGLSVKDIDPTQLASIAKQYGLTPQEISAAVAEEKKTRDEAQAEKDAQAIKDNSFSISEGQSYYKYNPTTKEYDLVASKAKTYAPGTGGGGSGLGATDPTVAAWVQQIQSGAAKITNVPAAYKNSVIRALSASTGGTNVSQLANEALTAAKKLQDDFKGGKFAVGGSSLIPTLPGTKARDYQRNFDQLKALLSLDNIKYLKGTGAISDAEQRLLANAASSIALDMSEQEYSDTLKTLVDTLTPAATALTTTDDGTPTGEPESYTLPNGTVVTRQADGTYK